MNQPTSLTRGSRTSWKDASTPPRRNWYIEPSSYSMRLSILKSKSGCAQRSAEKMSHTKPCFSTQRSMRWQSKISSVTNRTEESHNRPPSTPSKPSRETARKVPRPAVHTEWVARVLVTARCAGSATLHISLKIAQLLAKKCHKCGSKNHFSSCCRSSRSNGQDSDRHRGRTPGRGRSPERRCRPSQGRHSRSRSRSRSGSQTRNTHSIEIDWYDIDDIDVLRTFHSISRSRSVAAISNDTDPDGKTKILTKLRVKLPYRNVADVMEVKVDDGAEANILPLHTSGQCSPIN